MIAINMPAPASCGDCPFKGDKWCYMALWLKDEPKDVPEYGRPVWCPIMDMDDDRK